MILTVLLNAILCLAVLVVVVSPLVWAIVTQHRDQPAVGGAAGASTAVPARSPRGRTHQRYAVASRLS
ncbi:MAG TPA: hypothetical protein VJ741_03450 [Solirubrobacteraceae bacterium]|nr:hypothetical protein [Solirubrobacteraceae bacterium]